MSSNQITPCGCRCNTANDTREGITIELEDDVRLAAYVSARNPVLYSEGGFVGRDFVSGLESEVGTHRGRGGDEEHGHRCATVLGRSYCVLLRSACSNHRCDVVVGFPDEVRVAMDSGPVDGQAAGPHCSSPVVAESEADTSDAPAMTVQEGGGSTAAPGVEGVSPAPSTPRFVAVSDRVYDRDANKVAACVSLGAARSVAAELNTGNGHIANFYWEDAK